MNKRRLLKLADLLESDAKKSDGVKFDLSTWAKAITQERFPKPRNFKTLDCNTSACAIGLACLSGAFKKEGLSWRRCEYENNIVPIFKHMSGIYAGEVFFEINSHDFMYLFSAHHYAHVGLPKKGARAERAVAKRIRDYVSDEPSNRSHGNSPINLGNYTFDSPGR